MMNEIFDINNFNIFSDDEYYYFFRALNASDTRDLEMGIITDSNGNITRIRTNLERYEDIPKYTKDDEMSLDQIVNHIKMHQRKDTNCISLTSNANTALTYGRGSYSDEYVMIKIKKNAMNTDVYQAGLYMLNEIEKIISLYYQNGALDDIQMYYIDRINNARNQEELNKIKNEVSSSNTGDKEFQKGLLLDVTLSGNFNSLNEHQNFLKNKTILKIDVLNKKIVKGMSNKFLIQTIGNAFSSLELIHYGDIPGSKITYIPSELMDILGLIQQLPSNLENLNELKREIITKSQTIKLNGKYSYSDFSVVEDELSLEKMFDLTNGQIDYKTAYTMYKKAFYLCKSRLRTDNSVKLLKKIIGNNSKYDEILKYIGKKTFGIEPEITTRLSNDLINVSESVSLNFSNKERELFEFINSLSLEDTERVMNEPFSTIKILLEKFMFENEDVLNMSKEEWFANSIIDLLDLRRFNVVENLNIYQRRDIINKMLEFDFINKYNFLKDQGYNKKTTINLLFTSMIRNTDDVSISDLFTLEELEDFVGYNRIIGTDFELRTYQKPVVDKIEEIFKTRKFASAVLPTGAGKSYVALSEMNKYKNKQILYLAPNNEILDQIVTTIRKLYHPEEHIPDHVEDVIKRKFPNLILATYQRLKEESASEIINKKYSMIVFDELHRTGASEWSKKINDLVDNQDNNVKILGITATPERDVDLQNMTYYWASKLGYTEEEIDMGEHMAANMDIITAMKCGYICHPKVVCCEYSLIADGSYDEMKFRIDELSNSELKRELDYRYDMSRREVEKADGIEKILTDNLEKDGKYIVFLPISRKKDGTYEDEDGNNVSKTEASKIIKDYQMLLNQYLYSSNYFEKNKIFINNIYEKIISNIILEQDELDFLEMEKENILLLSSISIISKPQALNTKNEIIADSIIKYMNWEKLDKKVMNKKLSMIMRDEVENLSMLGSYNYKKNKQNLANFNQKANGKMKFMFVMNKLNEGVHVEDIDGIVWLRPLDENSKILYLQQLGRCIFSVTNNNYKRPIVIDLVNNTLKVDFEKGLTDIDKDVIKISTIERWVKTNNRLPLKSSSNQTELEFAEILNSLNKKYIKYIDENAIAALPKENRNKIRKIIEIGSDIDLWNMETWTIQNERKLREDEPFLSFLGIDAIVKDFLELKKDVEKNSIKDFEFYFGLLNKIKEQGGNINYISSVTKAKLENNGKISLIRKRYKSIDGETIQINKDEYFDKSLINIGSWLCYNQQNLTEEQKRRLRDIGYVLKGEEKDIFETYYGYLVKLKEQGKNTNLTSIDKLKVNDDGTLSIITKRVQMLNGRYVILNQDEFFDENLISIGSWLVSKQQNFTEQQKQRLRDIGYVLKGSDGTFETYYGYLKKLKEQGDNINLTSQDKLKINGDSSISVIKRKCKMVDGIQTCVNREEYYSDDLINIGLWLKSNQDKFTEEQKQRLRDIGYVLKGEEKDIFETYYGYLEKLKEQGDNTNLKFSEKLKINDDGTIKIVKLISKMVDGKEIISNTDEYYADNVILVGSWLKLNQDKFTEEQKQRLRDIGYVLKGEEEDIFETYYGYLVKLKEQGDNTNLVSSDRIRINNDGTIDIIKEKKKRIGNTMVVINKEEISADNLIKVGYWLKSNQDKFTEEQKQRLRDIGYVLKGEEDSFDLYFSYLERIKAQKENVNLARTDKIRLNSDGSISILKIRVKSIDGKRTKIHDEGYFDDDLFRLGYWLIVNQDKFTEEQKQRLRDIGYILREDAKKEYDDVSQIFDKDSHMRKVISNVESNKENVDGRKLY